MRRKPNLSAEELMKWVNSHSALQTKVRQVGDLSDCVAFLLILAQGYTKIVNPNKIIFQPQQSYEKEYNRKMLSAAIKKVYAADLAKLDATITQIGQKQNEKAVVDLALRLYCICGDSIGQAQIDNERIQEILPTSRVKTVIAPSSQLTPQKLKKKDDQKKLSKEDISQLHSNRQILRRSYSTNTSALMRNQKKPKKPVKIQIEEDFQSQTNTIIDSLSSIAILVADKNRLYEISKEKSFLHSTKEIDKLKQLIEIVFTTYLKRENLISNSSVKFCLSILKKQQIWQKSFTFLKSSAFLKQFFIQVASRKTILLLLKYICKVEELHSRKKIYDRKFHNLMKLQVQPFSDKKTSFWTQNLAILIAIEVNIIFQASRKRKAKDDKNDSLLFGGFTYFSKQAEVQMEQNVSISATIDKQSCEHLRGLFDKKVDDSAQIHQSLDALRKNIRIMLELKHKSIRYIFVKLYNIIVKEITSIKFKDIQKPRNRQKFLISVLQQVESCGKEIQQFLKTRQNMGILRDQTMLLLRATIYCFLSELNGFQINEMYCKAFDFALLK